MNRLCFSYGKNKKGAVFMAHSVYDLKCAHCSRKMPNFQCVTVCTVAGVFFSFRCLTYAISDMLGLLLC